MKKLLTALVAVSLLFAVSPLSAKKAKKQKAPKGAAAVAPAPAAPALAEGEIAAWDFTKKPTGRIQTSYVTYDSDIPVPAVEGSKEGNTLTVAGGSECKYLEEPNWFVAHNASDSCTLETWQTKPRATYPLVVAQDCTVEMTISGNGDAGEAKRWVLLADEANNVLASKDKMGKDPIETLSIAVKAGNYKIVASGSRIHKVTLKQ